MKHAEFLFFLLKGVQLTQLQFLKNTLVKLWCAWNDVRCRGEGVLLELVVSLGQHTAKSDIFTLGVPRKAWSVLFICCTISIVYTFNSFVPLSNILTAVVYLGFNEWCSLISFTSKINNKLLRGVGFYWCLLNFQASVLTSFYSLH